MLYAIVFVLIVLVDQISKAYVDANNIKQVVIDDIFSIWNARNSGAAFSMFSNEDWAQTFFILLTVVAISFGLAYLILNKKNSKWLNLSIAFILGGAVGNFIDRLAMGEVRDFLFVHFFANCNVADVFISVGGVMLVLYFLFFDDDAIFKKKPSQNQLNSGESGEET